MNPVIPQLAVHYKGSGSVFFIGRNTDYAVAVEIVPPQLPAYDAAKENGCDMDKPKNLAKSVTVEQLTRKDARDVR